LKLHILNLGHTVLAEAWIRRGRPARETVSEIMAQPRLYQHLSDIYATEVIPGFAARGMGEMALPYVGTTIERLRNPFLNHRIADIAQNHSTKVDRRIRSFLAWVRQDDPLLRLPQLTALAAEYA
jgi:tagaturonate reductase